MKKIPWSSAILLVCLATAASALDGKRSGFVFGAAAGPGLAMYHLDTVVYGKRVGGGDVSSAFAPSPHIFAGVAFTNEVEALASYTSSFFSFQNAGAEPVLVSDRILGLGIKYIMVTSNRPEDCDFDDFGTYIGRKWRRAPYLVGGIGISGWGTPFASGGGAMTGFGGYMGIGYEFMKHFALQGQYTLSSSFKRVTRGASGTATLYAKSHIITVYLVAEVF